MKIRGLTVSTRKVIITRRFGAETRLQLYSNAVRALDPIPGCVGATLGGRARLRL